MRSLSGRKAETVAAPVGIVSRLDRHVWRSRLGAGLAFLGLTLGFVALALRWEWIRRSADAAPYLPLLLTAVGVSLLVFEARAAGQEPSKLRRLLCSSSLGDRRVLTHKEVRRGERGYATRD